MTTKVDPKTLLVEMREMKRLIREDPEIRARYDVDGDGEISGDEWQRAMDMLRRELEDRPAAPETAAQATVESLRTEAAVAAGVPSLTTTREVVVQQQVEMTEALTGWETANRYVFRDAATNRELGGCDENRGGMGGALARQFLGPCRPLRLSLTTVAEGRWVEGKRPWAMLGPLSPPLMELSGPEGALATVRRVWPILLWRRYELKMHQGRSLFINGVLWHPWTFPVERGGRQVACIRKKWSGLGKEMLSDADNFRVQFQDSSLSLGEKLTVLAAALAIDFDFFETDGNG